jgi:hypothetical protein
VLWMCVHGCARLCMCADDKARDISISCAGLVPTHTEDGLSLSAPPQRPAQTHLSAALSPSGYAPSLV